MGLSPSKVVSSRVDELETTLHNLNNRLEELDPQDRFTRYNERLREIESSSPHQTDRLNTLAENVETLQSNVQTIEHNLQELQGSHQPSACLRTTDDNVQKVYYAYAPTTNNQYEYQVTDSTAFDILSLTGPDAPCVDQTTTVCFGIYNDDGKNYCVNSYLSERCEIPETGFTWKDLNGGKDVHVMMCPD